MVDEEDVITPFKDAKDDFEFEMEQMRQAEDDETSDAWTLNEGMHHSNINTWSCCQPSQLPTQNNASKI